MEKWSVVAGNQARIASMFQIAMPVQPPATLTTTRECCTFVGPNPGSHICPRVYRPECLGPKIVAHTPVSFHMAHFIIYKVFFLNCIPIPTSTVVTKINDNYFVFMN